MPFWNYVSERNKYLVNEDAIDLLSKFLMYDPEKRVYFIPNMSTVIDAQNKQIISSPQMVKDNVQGFNQNQEQQNIKEEDDNNEQ